jgi:single-stranded-DNA-specific exonuclease
MPRISVITTAYNSERFIENSLLSILNQSLNKNDYEVIVINDGSTDNTSKIIKSIKDDRIKFFDYQENEGVTKRSIDAILKSTGEYIAILNSKQEDCEYAYDMLCGAAVAYKLVQALIAKGNFNLVEGWEKWLLDLVGISTVADMVPLTGENRVFAHYGLKVLRKSPRPGLQKLLRVMKMNQATITEDDIGFMIAPRINAASRMGDPRLAFDLLSASEGGNGETLAKELQKLNDTRKGVVASMVKEMKHNLSEREELREVIVLGNPNWRPGLLGLAANTLVEEHSRPVFLWGREGGETLKGSCRSDGTVDLVALMGAVPKDLFLEFGGHAASGGFQVAQEYVHLLEEELSKAYMTVKEVGESEEVFVDSIIPLDEVNMATWRAIEPLAPFGMGNPKPIFMLQNIVPEKARMFGKTGEHLELTFRKTNGDFVRAIEFFSTREVKEGERIPLIANLERSTFGRYPEIRLRIVDIV